MNGRKTWQNLNVGGPLAPQLEEVSAPLWRKNRIPPFDGKKWCIRTEEDPLNSQWVNSDDTFASSGKAVHRRREGRDELYTL